MLKSFSKYRDLSRQIPVIQRRPSKERAAVLVSALVIIGVLAITLLANLSLVANERGLLGRAQAWNTAIPMCEAGVEDAMAHLNYSGTTNLASDGWVLTNGAYLRTYSLAGGYYTVTISTASPPLIVSQGFTPAPMETNYISRTVQVSTRLNGQFPMALLAKNSISLGGNGLIDSFNSTNSLYSTSGNYDPAKAEANAQVGTVNGATGAISVGNGMIYGSVDTGPGGTVTVGSNGSVGDTAWDGNPAHNGQIESGHSAADVNTIIPDVVLPSMGIPLIPLPGILGGTNYTYALAGGNYEINSSFSLGGQQAMVISAPSVLYVSGNFSMAGQAFIYVAPGASLKLYIGGASCSMAGGGIVNGSQSAANVEIFGLPACTSLSYSGGATFMGTIYAPEADCTLTGNGGACGAAVGNSFTMTGNGSFHYDESLGGPVGYKYLVASWQEL